MKKGSVLKIAISVLFLSMGLQAAIYTVNAETVPDYDVDKAVEYAKEHFDDTDSQDCIQFVKDCFEAGGVPKDESRKDSAGVEYGYTVSGYVDFVTQSGYAELIPLTTEKMDWDKPQWYVRMTDNEGRLSVGDGVIYKCLSCGKEFHSSVVTGVNEDGYALYYAQKVPVENMPLCQINCSSCKADYTNVELYALHVKSAAHGYDASYNNVTVTGLKAVHSDDEELTLSWNKAESATGYYVFRKTSKSSYAYNFFAETSSTSVVSIEPDFNGIYNFAVRPYKDVDGKRYVGAMSEACLYQSVPVVTVEKDASTGKPVISWTSVPGADTYIVWRSSTGTGEWYKLYETTDDKAYVYADAKENTPYYYMVSAKSSSSQYSMLSEPVLFTYEVEKLASPVIQVTTLSTGKPKITWNAVAGADKYTVYRSASGKTGTFYSLITTTKTSCTHTGAKAGTTYYYMVRAVDADNTASNSLNSNVEKAVCKLGTSTVSVSYTTAGKPKITWTAVSGADQYYLYRSTSGETGTFTRLFIAKDGKTSYTHTGATAGTKYYYMVRAVDSDNSAVTSANSNLATGMYLSSPTIKVTNVTTTGKPKITWDAVAGAEKYIVYRSASGKTGTFYSLITTTKTSCTHTGAKAGTKYYYMVRAIDEDLSLTSKNSNVISTVCDLASPTINVQLTTVGKPRITWEAVPGADQYYVYRSASGKTGTFTRLFIAKDGKTSCTHTGAKAGTTYYYMVRAIDADNSNATSANSNVFSIVSE